MAVRITSTEVLQIMDGCTTSPPIVESLIAAASRVVDKVFEDDTSMSAEQLTEVERWLTAHMLASTLFRTASEEKIGDTAIKYTGKWGEMLKSTPYGQMVLLLDTSGLLAKQGKVSASIYAIKQFEE